MASSTPRAQRSPSAAADVTAARTPGTLAARPTAAPTTSQVIDSTEHATSSTAYAVLASTGPHDAPGRAGSVGRDTALAVLTGLLTVPPAPCAARPGRVRPPGRAGRAATHARRASRRPSPTRPRPAPHRAPRVARRRPQARRAARRDSRPGPDHRRGRTPAR